MKKVFKAIVAFLVAMFVMIGVLVVGITVRYYVEEAIVDQICEDLMYGRETIFTEMVLEENIIEEHIIR